MINLIFIFGAKYLYLGIIIIAFIWFLSQNNSRKREILLLSCICLPLIFITCEIAGRLYYNPQPFVVGNFEPLISHQADNGFPSHHTLLVSAVSTIVFLFNRRLSLVLWFLTLFVGFSRVYAGVHHIIDVIASIFISIIVITLTHFFWKIIK